jgi:hypothetical protein
MINLICVKCKNNNIFLEPNSGACSCISCNFYYLLETNNSGQFNVHCYINNFIQISISNYDKIEGLYLFFKDYLDNSFSKNEIEEMMGEKVEFNSKSIQRFLDYGFNYINKYMDNIIFE